MIEQLFGSKTRVKLLQLFYQNPSRSFYVREITRKIDEQINSVRRELANLLSIGLIKSDTNNNRLYYEVNQSFEHYPALSSMFAGKKFKASKKEPTAADEAVEKEAPKAEAVAEAIIDDPFAKELAKAGNIRLAIYTGQFTRDESTGVDIVIVGDINYSALENLISELEANEKKELRYSVFAPEEFAYRRQVNDKFIVKLIDAKKVLLINRDNLL
jgi:predicted transcriptional regulator with HTH domain